MRFRKLRIAWSVGCGVIAVLLVVLWVRSYWRGECIFYLDSSNKFAGVRSEYGAFVIYSGQSVPTVTPVTPGWGYDSSKAERRFSAFEWNPDPLFGATIVMPHWFVAATLATLAAVSWLPWRFSLRTLLIATTLVAVVLGMVVWMSRLG